jgi:hypothetical protein
MCCVRALWLVREGSGGKQRRVGRSCPLNRTSFYATAEISPANSSVSDSGDDGSDVPHTAALSANNGTSATSSSTSPLLHPPPASLSPEAVPKVFLLSSQFTFIKCCHISFCNHGQCSAHSHERTLPTRLIKANGS